MQDSAYVGFERRKNIDRIGQRATHRHDGSAAALKQANLNAAWKERMLKEEGDVQQALHSHAPWGSQQESLATRGSEFGGKGRAAPVAPQTVQTARVIVDRLAPGWGASEQLRALGELCELAAHGKKSRKQLMEAGATKALEGLLKESSGLPDKAAACCAALGQLASDDEFRSTVAHGGAVGLLLKATRSSSSSCRREAVGAIWSLSHRQPHVAQAVAAGAPGTGASGFGPLVKLLHSEDAATARGAAGCARATSPQLRAVSDRRVVSARWRTWRWARQCIGQQW
jgi:hypothetical protein